MRASDIVAQLANFLPALTGRFSDTVGITSILGTVGGTITVETSTPHSLSVGGFANIIDVNTPNAITSLTAVGKVATATTTNNHDLTEDRFKRCTIEITGADDPAYNGVHKLLTVPTRTTFTYQLDAVPALSPDTGVPTLLEFFAGRGYNGRHLVTAVGSTTSFDYVITAFIPLTLVIGVGGIVRMRHRVTRAESIDSAIETYSKQGANQLWAYAILGGTAASKDRNIGSDAGQQKTASADARQSLIFNASVFVFFPATDDIRAGAVRDLAQSEIMAAIIGSIVGANLPTGLTEYVWGKVAYEGDGKDSYNKAFYIHEYILQQTADITFCDRIRTDITVPLTRLDFDLFAETENILASGSITL